MSKSEVEMAKDPKTELRLDNLEELPAKIDNMTKILIRLETLFDGGPGHWETCRQHKETIDHLDKRLGKIEVRFWAWSGAVTVLIVVANILGPTVRHLLGIGPKP